MKNLKGASNNNTNEMQGLANKYADGDMTRLVNTIRGAARIFGRGAH